MEQSSRHTCDGAPTFWLSKATSVAYANEDIGEAHADLSVAAPEIYAAANATIEALHMSYAVEEMGMAFPKPILLEMDNAAAEVFCNNTALKTRLKHIDVRQEWVRMLRNKTILLPKHVGSRDNLADFFTKILQPHDFQRLRESLMVQQVVQ